MFKKVLLGVALAVFGSMQLTPVFAEEVTIKLWSRADRSGPLRPGNIVEAANQMNRMFAAAGSDTQVKIELIETNSKGFDDDALSLLKAHSVGETPDIAVAAHEWIGSFVEAGLAANLEDHIKANAGMYADMIPQLWNSVSYKGERYGVPQDSEIRMFFINNDILRAAGKSEDYIASLPGLVEAGDFTMYDWCDLAAEAVKSGAAKVGWVHRPNVGPDFQMAMASFGGARAWSSWVSFARHGSRPHLTSPPRGRQLRGTPRTFVAHASRVASLTDVRVTCCMPSRRTSTTMVRLPVCSRQGS